MSQINRVPYYVNPEEIKVIGIIGKAGAGKSVISKIAEIDFGYQTLSFAYNLKKAAKTIFDLHNFDVATHNGKQMYNEYWEMTHRRMLQLLGSDALKPIFGPDIWCKSAHTMLHRGVANNTRKKFIFDDVRFFKEAEYIHNELGGTFIFVERPNITSSLTEEEQQHVSETEITLERLTEVGFPVSYIKNNQTLLNLRTTAFDVLQFRE